MFWAMRMVRVRNGEVRCRIDVEVNMSGRLNWYILDLLGHMECKGEDWLKSVASGQWEW